MYDKASELAETLKNVQRFEEYGDIIQEWAEEAAFFFKPLSFGAGSTAI